MLTMTYTQLKALSPCEESLRRVARLMGGARKWKDGVNAARAREAGATFDDLVWVASAISRTDKDAERRLRLWMADCAARVLHIYEKTEASSAPRAAITAARQFARGEINAAARDAARAAARDAARDAAWDAARDAAWAAARDAARDAAWDAAWAARGAAWAARDAAWAAARDAAWAAARDAAWAAAWAARGAAWAAGDAAWAAGDAAGEAAWAAGDAAGDAARDAEELWQFDRLILWLSENEPEDWPLPAVPVRAAAE